MSYALNGQSLPAGFSAPCASLAATWRESGFVERLWRRDASLWPSTDGEDRLGWLDIIGRQIAESAPLTGFADEIAREGIDDILLIGMGGSSLCPEVLAGTLGGGATGPRLHVLDSTDPAQVRSVEGKLDLARTLFFVSSKSGTTLEADILRRRFFERAGRALGRAAGDRFVAVTDPGSELEKLAVRDGYRRVFSGEASIGGRFSALSNFGMAPAAAMGIDGTEFLERARVMAEACRERDPELNPGVALGLLLGAAHRQGRDKLTLLASERLAPLGAWIEQLVAESLGKLDKSIIPIDLEAPGPPEVYGDDRLFTLIRLAGEDAHEGTAEALERAGHPVARIELAAIENLGQEFFRWEIAVAAAGAVMEVNPFDQPDVEASKIAAKRLTQAYEAGQSPLEEIPFYEESGVRLYSSAAHAVRLARSFSQPENLARYLGAHLDTLAPGDYFALLAFVEMNDTNREALEEIRRRVRNLRRVATCLGFGPRFLHSTGQAYKGGANNGVFLQITCDDEDSLEIPGKRYSFSQAKAAQARGDFEVLCARRRRVLRAHLRGDLRSGLDRLNDAFEQALRSGAD